MIRSAIGIALCVVAFCSDAVRAQQTEDTVWVRTLAFDSIFTRRGVWQFPDGGTYRKILMYHTLKCDPRTPEDRYNCGEWDAMTNTFIYEKTGRLDSARLRHPYFKVGAAAPDSIDVTDTPTQTTRQRYRYWMAIDSVMSENVYRIGADTARFPTLAIPHRMQFVLSKAEINAAGLTGSGAIAGLQLFAVGGGTLRNLTVRIKNAVSPSATAFDNLALTTVFSDNVTLAAGANTVYFTSPYSWDGNAGLIVDIGYDGHGGSPTVLHARNAPALIALGGGGHLLFDGTNDYVDCGAIAAAANAPRFTMEGWVRVDSWQSWNKVFGFGDRFHFELGDKEGTLYLMARNPYNTHGSAANALRTKTWAHIAMVFDGTAPDDARRLRLYVNGRRVALTFRTPIPTSIAPEPGAFTLTGLDWETASLAGALDEVRLFSAALDSATIGEWWNRAYTPSHPNADALVAYYPLNSVNPNRTVEDASNNDYAGRLIGSLYTRTPSSGDLWLDPATSGVIPAIALVRGTYRSHRDSSIVSETAPDPPISVAYYEIRDHAPVISSIDYVWRAGYRYTYDPAGRAIDSTPVAASRTLRNRMLDYFGRPTEVVYPHEIGRFITPYGINLDLGPEGFSWVYDVTDYAHLLKGAVELSSGDWRELIDLRFALIKGTPPRPMLRMQRLCDDNARYLYRDLSNDTALRRREFTFLPESRGYKVRTRITGHGHNSNDGSYPHCCEWKDNTHSLLLNDTGRIDWHIFQYDDCAWNPVYPQGGTWPGAREGWCPGDVVKDHDFELTPHVAGGRLALDYDITKMPADNPGMGDGVYHLTMQLFEYGPPSHAVDAEAYQVMAPNGEDYFSRRNPTCSGPVVLVRNNGAAPITTLEITYGVSGGQQETYRWSGSIAPHAVDTIALPIGGNSFWLGDAANRFTVRVARPNGADDQYAVNDAFTTTFNRPDLHAGRMVLWYRTNRRPEDFTLHVLDAAGAVVHVRENAAPETLYRDTLDLQPGCYTVRLVDRNNLGLSYWAYTEQGNGYLRLYNDAGKILKSFNPDCGAGIYYSFSLGNASRVDDRNLDAVAAVFPNPAAGSVTLAIDEFPLGEAEVKLFAADGSLVRTERHVVGDRFRVDISTRDLSPGAYMLTITNGEHRLLKRFVKR